MAQLMEANTEYMYSVFDLEKRGFVGSNPYPPDNKIFMLWRVNDAWKALDIFGGFCVTTSYEAMFALCFAKQQCFKLISLVVVTVFCGTFQQQVSLWQG